ncbi:hypothetical protein Gotur_008497 [Gossypium turneri]
MESIGSLVGDEMILNEWLLGALDHVCSKEEKVEENAAWGNDYEFNWHIWFLCLAARMMEALAFGKKPKLTRTKDLRHIWHGARTLFRDVFAGIDPDLDAQVEFGAFQKLGDPTTIR